MRAPAILASALLIALSGAAPGALAQEAPEPEDGTHFVTVTGGVDSLEGIIELSGEVCLAPRHGVAFTWGLAPYDSDHDQLSASYRYSVLGDFDTGLLVGGELTTIGPNGWGLGVGAAAFGGAKYTAPFGLSAEALLGGSVHAGEPWIMATLAAGWSFGQRL
jgi:hypothetical protein